MKGGQRNNGGQTLHLENTPRTAREQPENTPSIEVGFLLWGSRTTEQSSQRGHNKNKQVKIIQGKLPSANSISKGNPRTLGSPQNATQNKTNRKVLVVCLDYMIPGV